MAAALARKLEGGTVICTGDARDDHGRLLARCSLGEEDLSTWVVERGYALAFRYSTRLVPVEEAAKAARRGLWRGAFEPPPWAPTPWPTLSAYRTLMPFGANFRPPGGEKVKNTTGRLRVPARHRCQPPTTPCA